MAVILVVDDHATNRELVRTVLGYAGHQVIEAHEVPRPWPWPTPSIRTSS